VGFSDFRIRIFPGRVWGAALGVLVALALAHGSEGAGSTGPTPPSKKSSSPPLRIFVGTYTGAGGRGIYKVELDASTGAVVAGPSLAAPSENPSFLALHPNGRFLYAVNEVGAAGAVSAFSVDSDSGALSLLNQQPSEGADPCHLTVDPAGRNVLVANYTSGSVAVLPIASDGSLRPPSSVRQLTGSGPNKVRQAGPHAHQVAFDPSKKFLLTVDLGSDRILVEPGEPGGVALEAGSGPRHLAWHPNGKTLYVICELSGSISGLRWDAERGVLSPFQRISSLPPGFSGANTAAEIAVSPDGRFVYASNRGDDALTIFSVGGGGRLAFAGRVPTGGRTPRHFAIDPSGRWLVAANQNSSSLVVFRLDPATGLPRRVGGVVVIPEPVCILFAGSR
jgi:6-phosphogluconolactonase